MKIFCFALAFLVASCNVDKEKRIVTRKAKFSTSDASELFFKNIRQNHYDKEESDGGKMIVNRLIGRSQANNHPIINLAIVINWRHDESYILVEPNAYLDSLQRIRVAWTNQKDGSIGEYVYEKGNKEDQFLFAAHIYSSILRGDNLFIKSSDNILIPLLTDKKEREVFRKTMLDYFRLVDLV